MAAPLGDKRQDGRGQLRGAQPEPGVLGRDDVVELPLVDPFIGGVPAAGDGHEHHERGQAGVAAERGVRGRDPGHQLQREQNSGRAERPDRHVDRGRGEPGSDFTEPDQDRDRRSDERPAERVAHIRNYRHFGALMLS